MLRVLRERDPSSAGGGGAGAGSGGERLPSGELPAPGRRQPGLLPQAGGGFGPLGGRVSILMLPADVANRQACRHALYNGACSLTLPMKTLWIAVYIADAVLVFFVIPFAMFYYEGDQDKSIAKRLRSALCW
uniref:Uncharacterized protein n=1 Tax=Ananas comosus var. bracteatus TaxID=296719 RepID=A0A6V7PH74_ANACO|nr:unnamed protein product [Ananas comosus var. bracteatus]